MTCRKVIRKLPAYLAGELPERARGRVENHLKHCVLCTGELRALRRTDQLLDTLGEVEPRRDLVGLVMRRIEREQEAIPAFKRFLISLRERRPQLVRSAAYVVALLMLAFGLQQYYQARRPAPNDGARRMSSGPETAVVSQPRASHTFAPLAQLGRGVVRVFLQRRPAPETSPEGEEFTYRLDENGVASLNRELEAARNAIPLQLVERPFPVSGGIRPVDSEQPVLLSPGPGGKLIIENGPAEPQKAPE